MNPIPFTEQTNVLSAPKDWDAASQGECVELPVKFDPSTPSFTSVWQPSAEEREALAAGGAVRLTLFSTVHVPVAVEAVDLQDGRQDRAVATMTGAQWAEAHRLLRRLAGFPVDGEQDHRPVKERAADLLSAVYAAQPDRIRSAGRG